MTQAKSILITGGAGFIGGHLVKKLLEETAADIFVVDDLSVGSLNFLPKSPRVTFLEKSILSEGAMQEAFATARPEVVYHLAAKCFLPDCAQDPNGTVETNVLGTEVIVRLCNQYATKQLIFASSCAVYDVSNKPLKEDALIGPREIYGISKLLGENLVRYYAQVPWTIVRLFTVYGSNTTQEYLIPTLLKQLKESSTVLLGNIETRRDYIYIDDIVSGLVKIIDNGKAYEEVLNLAFGMSHSGSDLIGLLEESLGIDITVVFDSARARKNDNPDIRGDASKAKSMLGWSAQVSLQEGLSKMLE